MRFWEGLPEFGEARAQAQARDVGVGQKDTLGYYRSQIDTLDKQIVDLLVVRGLL